MNLDYKERYLSWIKSDPNASIMTEKEIKSSFSSDLSFGTAGLRAVMGIGTNRLNVHTVKRVTLALCNYLKRKFDSNIRIAIAYDTRYNSEIFAKEAAKILIKNKITAYLSKNPEPTPFLSYCVRYNKCNAGIMITASHNPPQYNGYKCYDENGCQIREKMAREVSKEMEKLPFFFDCDTKKNNPPFKYIGKSCKDEYLKDLKKHLTQQKTEKLRVTFTPLNGCSSGLITHIAKEHLKIKNFFTVKEQEVFDPNFTTCKNPNPESEEVFDLAVKLSYKTNSDIILAVDPDGDRIGVCVKNRSDKYTRLDGNQVGVLILDYISKTKKNIENKFIIKSIVSTPMIEAIAKNYGLKIIEVLTGFKYIGEKIESLKEKFLFGFEESCGYLLGDYVRDKDAILTFGLICQATAFYKSVDKNLLEIMDELYKKYGYYKETTLAPWFSETKKQEIIKKIRNENFKKISNYKIIKKRDLLKENSELPKSDVLIFELEDFKKVVIRPSGTESKIKIYLFSKDKTKEASKKSIKKLEKDVAKLISEISLP